MSAITKPAGSSKSSLVTGTEHGGADRKPADWRDDSSVQETRTVDITVIEYAQGPDGCWRSRMRGDGWTLCWSRSLSEVLAETAAYVQAVRSCCSPAAQPEWREVSWRVWQDPAGAPRLN